MQRYLGYYVCGSTHSCMRCFHFHFHFHLHLHFHFHSYASSLFSARSSDDKSKDSLSPSLSFSYIERAVS